MLKIFSRQVSIVTVFCFLFAPLVMGITLHLHVQFVTAGTIVQKKDDVTSSSFLEDAARKQFCFAFYSLLPFGQNVSDPASFSLRSISLEVPFACCTLFSFGVVTLN